MLEAVEPAIVGSPELIHGASWRDAPDLSPYGAAAHTRAETRESAASGRPIHRAKTLHDLDRIKGGLDPEARVGFDLSVKLSYSSPQESADHEIGHYFAAVVTRMQPIPVFITIKEGQTEDGDVTGGKTEMAFAQRHTRSQWYVYLMAGMEAHGYGIAFREGVAAANARRDDVTTGGSADVFFAQEVAGRRDVNLYPYQMQARQIVIAGWDAISVMSQELMAHETLYGDECGLVLRVATDLDPKWKDLLDDYRKHRREIKPAADYLTKHPGMKQYERLETFVKRRDSVLRRAVTTAFEGLREQAFARIRKLFPPLEP